MAGTMEYMHRQADRRTNPASIVPGATHVVMLARGYFTQDAPKHPNGGRVARYARGRDYHVALRKPLEDLAAFIRSLEPSDIHTKVFVDAGPVPERELAQRAGLGWIGKNTMLIDPKRGSYFFLASVFTDLALAVDEPFTFDHCGTCRRCLDACPTGAFPDVRVLDSRRCISYLTIEHRGELDPERRPLVTDWVFGCDVCQEVCPWNEKFARAAPDEYLELEGALAWLDLTELATLDDAAFDTKYGWTPMERAGAGGMRRNARLVRENRA